MSEKERLCHYAGPRLYDAARQVAFEKRISLSKLIGLALVMYLNANGHPEINEGDAGK